MIILGCVITLGIVLMTAAIGATVLAVHWIDGRPQRDRDAQAEAASVRAYEERMERIRLGLSEEGKP